MLYFRNFNLTVLFLIGLHANYADAGQSKLPPCPSDYKIAKSFFGDGPDERWNNCFGQSTDPENQTYLGEWKDGLPHGQGLLKGSNNTYILGTFKRQKPEGYAISFDDSGNILFSGFVENRKFISKADIDYRNFDKRLTKKLVAKDWEKYFLTLKDGEFIGYFDCVKTGFRYYDILDSDSEYPALPPDSPQGVKILGKCKKFVSQNKLNIQKIGAPPFECPISNFSSQCFAQFLIKDSRSGGFVQHPIENVYELAFTENEWKFVVTETNDGQTARLEAERAKALILASKEAERADAERKEALSKEAGSKEMERVEIQKKGSKLDNDVKKSQDSIWAKQFVETEAKIKADKTLQKEVLKEFSGDTHAICVQVATVGMGYRLVDEAVGLAPDEKFEKNLGSLSAFVNFYSSKRKTLERIHEKYGREREINTSSFFKKHAPKCFAISNEISLKYNSVTAERYKSRDKPSDLLSARSAGPEMGDKVILPKLSESFAKSGIVAYKAQGSVCKNATDLESLFREEIANRYRSQLSLVRLIRAEAEKDTCTAIVDTVHGPIKCSVGSVLVKKGDKRYGAVLSTLYEAESGLIAQPFSCRPHPEVFERR